MKKERILTILFFAFVAVILMLGLRGLPGNPTSEELNASKWTDDGPLELSPDRGRFALLYSITEDHSLSFSLPIARFTTPDLGISPAGEYVSLFAPGVSFIAIPGYFLGKIFGVSQVGAFAVIALFALFNVALIRAIAKLLGASVYAANVGAMAFLFGTPAFAYAATIYQHHISAFFILSSVFALLKWRGWWSIAYVWFAAALSLSVDYPNLFLMFPVGLWALSRIIWLRRSEQGLHINLSFKNILTFISVVLPMALFFWFNAASNGSPLQLSGTLQRVEAIDKYGQPVQSQLAKTLGLAVPEPSRKKSAIGFFRTRNLLNGLYIHFLSPDRGIINFAPVMLFGILGFINIFRKYTAAGNVLLAVIGFDVLLYSMWGDPSGGWAFGSRYMIPAYAILGITTALALTRFRKNYIFLAIFLVVFGYSAWVNALGAITSNKMPPQHEILELEKITSHQEKFTYERDLDLLKANKSKSFVFQAVARPYITAVQYHNFITAFIIAMAIWLVSSLAFFARTRGGI